VRGTPSEVVVVYKDSNDMAKLERKMKRQIDIEEDLKAQAESGSLNQDK
jgi:alpha/beta superfamily hydrolase